MNTDRSERFREEARGPSREISPQYLAALLDVRGSISRPSKTDWQVQVAMREDAEDLLEACRRQWGGRLRGPGNWIVQGKALVQRLLEDVLPSMHSTKRQSALQALEWTRSARGFN